MRAAYGNAALALVCGLTVAAQAWANDRLRFRGAFGQSYAATVVRVADGDTLTVSVPAWAGTPFETMRIRVDGIDAPETHKPPGRCKAELALGKKAQVYARTLAVPGAAVTIRPSGFDKYARLNAAVTLTDGSDWAATMLSVGLARPYDGKTKPNWCSKAPIPPARPAGLGSPTGYRPGNQEAAEADERQRRIADE